MIALALEALLIGVALVVWLLICKAAHTHAVSSALRAECRALPAGDRR